jgi:hypothetical protein
VPNGNEHIDECFSRLVIKIYRSYESHGDNGHKIVAIIMRNRENEGWNEETIRRWVECVLGYLRDPERKLKLEQKFMTNSGPGNIVVARDARIAQSSGSKRPFSGSDSTLPMKDMK